MVIQVKTHLFEAFDVGCQKITSIGIQGFNVAIENLARKIIIELRCAIVIALYKVVNQLYRPLMARQGSKWCNLGIGRNTGQCQDERQKIRPAPAPSPLDMRLVVWLDRQSVDLFMGIRS